MTDLTKVNEAVQTLIDFLAASGKPIGLFGDLKNSQVCIVASTDEEFSTLISMVTMRVVNLMVREANKMKPPKMSIN